MRLRSDNEDFRNDLSDVQSSIHLLKVQLKAVEAQAAPHMDKSMRVDIERWKSEWRAVDLRLKHRQHLYERRASSETSESVMDVNTNGMSSSMHTSPIISRPGLMSRLDSDPFIDDESSPGDDTADDDQNNHQQNPMNETTGETARDDASVEDEAVPELPPPQKTPWQELWASITEFAGVLDYDDSD